MKKVRNTLTILIFFVLISIVTASFACSNKPTGGSPTEGAVIVKQSGGAGMMISECGDRSYITGTADYIIEGTVGNVESRWNESRTAIFTYTDLTIDNYVKGTPFTVNELQIVTSGGTVGDITQWVEDQPIFHEGTRVRIYFQDVNGEFFIVCGTNGVEEI
jgi:hypothetical protein